MKLSDPPTEIEISELLNIEGMPEKGKEIVRRLSFQRDNLIRLLDTDYPRDIFQELIKKSPYWFYLTQWVPYQTDARKWRLKMNHDVKTFDGREEHGIWPNGSSCGSFKDEEVEFIRISKEQHGRAWVDPRDEPEA